MYTSETQIRVRYAETDQMGYVYYGHYATYYEVARVEALRKLGFIYRELEEMGIIMPVVESRSKYLLPAKYDELLTIKISIPKLPGARIIFNYEIYNESGQCINNGETTLVFLGKTTGKPQRMPKVLHELFVPYFK